MKTSQEIFTELCKPFTKTVAGRSYPDLKWKPQNQAGQRLICVPYIDRYHVSERLNEVMGLDGWQFEIKRETDGSKTGSLSLLIGDKWITREDTGTQSQQEAEKGATSDALKRCATHFGIGAYIKNIPNIFVPGKLNNRQKFTPCINDRFLYSDQLSAYCNGMSSSQGILAQLLVEKPDLWEREEMKKLWEELKNN